MRVNKTWTEELPSLQEPDLPSFPGSLVLDTEASTHAEDLFSTCYVLLYMDDPTRTNPTKQHGVNVCPDGFLLFRRSRASSRGEATKKGKGELTVRCHNRQ
jgi:hypothetical protein